MNTDQNTISRRSILKLLGAAAGLSFIPCAARPARVAAAPGSFTYCLNTATIRGHKLGLVRELQTASQAGFGAVEIWMDTLQDYLSSGGSLKELRRRLDDLGVRVESAIGFAEWIVDDETRRNKGIELLKKEMDQLAQLGCHRTAAPPAGATDTPGLDLHKAADRYGAVLELGKQTGVVPHLEMWGFSKNLSKLSELLFVAAESGHSEARLLLDNFHLYKGGTSINALSLLNPQVTEIFHVNDYPSTITAEQITDEDRIYPGDGVAPIREVLQTLKHPSRPLIISFETFNKEYYRQDALHVAKTAMAKMRKVTEGI